jgi:hypothetical protein
MDIGIDMGICAEAASPEIPACANSKAAMDTDPAGCT